MPSRRAVVSVVSPVIALGAALAHVRRNAGATNRRLRAAAARSTHARDGRFANPEPGEPRPDVSIPRIAAMVRRRNEIGIPPGPIPLAPLSIPAQAADLAVTWLGHAGVLLEIDGRRVLVDPVWSTRVSPVPFFGPRRMHPPPGPLAAVAADTDVVVISHDHYDHLDRPTVRRLARDTTATFVVPVGVDEHLRAWGVPDARIVALDWEGTADVAGLRLTCLPARHFSGRWLTRNTTQWAAFSVAGPRHRAYLGGDTGPSRTYERTGADHGPFDLTVLPIGAYAPIWPDIHATPEQAVDTHLALRGRLLLPIHWATFNLGFHGWAEPADRLVSAAADAGVRIVTPRVGERVDVAGAIPAERWWTTLHR